MNMKKIAALFASLSIYMASSLTGYAQFVDGVKGLLTMPSAEFEQDATFTITNNFLNREFLPKRGWNYNTFGYAFDVTLWGRVELAYSLTLFVGKWRPDYETATYRQKIMFNQDRHFAGRVALTKDGEWGQKWLPAIAIGVSDPVTGSGGDYLNDNVSSLSGNGYFNRYYVAVSKNFKSPIGDISGHLAYQYSRRKDGMPTGPCAAITWNPAWLNPQSENGSGKLPENSFLTNFRATLEYDARKVNFGLNASIWKNHFEFMAMLYGMRYPMVGLRFKHVLGK